MQNTTANYKLEINKPSREFECKITIGNNIYNNDELVNLTLEHTQPQEGFSIGNTISQSLDLTLLNRGDIIYSTSQIKVEIGLKIGSTIEYILMGIFNIDDIEKTDYTTKFTAYDNMIKFETPYFSSLGDKPTLKQVVNELSKITGIEFIGSLPNYTVSKLEGFTCREVLSYVASICGGNAVITRDGKFTIKSLSEIKKSIDGNNYFEYKKEEIKYKIGKISCQVDENNILSKGSISTDSMELEFENPWVTENILNDIYTKLKSVEYLGYSIKWQGDISLDPYDIITITDVKNITRRVPIFSQKFNYTGGLTSEIGAKGESKNKNIFSSSGSTSNKVNRVVMEQAVIKEALINKANIRDLEASNAKIENLQVKAASIESAIIGVAYISDLTAINANIQNLIAADAKINTALINKADITELNAVQGNITSLNSQIANIQTLVNGNLSSENIQAGGITSDKLTIANGFITNAMIANLDVSKINAGDISTNKFRIVSDNGGIEIVGATQQFKDKNNKVRIQMGQDAKGNFNFILRGEDGTTTLIDHTGIKEKAIADNLIKGNMVATDAIGEKQINYSSLITGLNKDTNTQLIKASKVEIDLAGQTLDLAFNSLKNQADNNKNIIENHSTNISAMQGQISTAINNTQIVKDGKTILLKDDYNRTVTKVDSINNTIGTHTTKINELTGNISSVDTKVNSVQRDLEGTKSTVSSHTSQISGLNSTVSTQGASISQLKNQIALKVEATDITTAINKINIGGRNLLKNSNFKKGFTNWNISTDGTIVTDATFENVAKIKATTSSKGINQKAVIQLETQKQYTLSCYVKSNVATKVALALNGSGISNAVLKDVGTSWVRISHTFTNDGYNAVPRIYTGENKSVELYIANVLFEEGNKCSSWTAALEDIDNSIADVQTQITTTSNKVAAIETNLSSITQRVSATETNITSITTDFNNMQIGVRNLLIGGKSSCYTSYNTITSQNGTKEIVFKWTASYAGSTFTLSNNGFKPKGTYTISGYITVNGAIPTSKYFIGLASTYGNNLKENYYDSSTGYFRITQDYPGTSIWILHAPTTRSSGSSDIVILTKLKLEKGDKATDWIPAYEDTDNSIADVQTQITNTSNKVATIETNLSSITQKVSSVENTTTKINGNITNLQNRMSIAEEKITDSAIINTVKATINTAKNEAINSANSSTDNKLKNYATTSLLTQTANNITASFKSSGGYNLIENSSGAGGLNCWSKSGAATLTYGKNINNGSGVPSYMALNGGTSANELFAWSKRFPLKPNTKYTLSGYFYNYTQCKSFDVFVLSSTTLDTTDTSDGYTNAHLLINSQNTSGTWKKFSVTFTTPANTKSGYVRIDTNGYNSAGAKANKIYWNALMLCEGDMERPWTPHPSEIYEGSTIIDGNGLTITQGNGAKAIITSEDFKFADKTDDTGLAMVWGGLEFYSKNKNKVNENCGFMKAGIKSAISADCNGTIISNGEYGDFISIAKTTSIDLNTGSWNATDMLAFIPNSSFNNMYGGRTGIIANDVLHIDKGLRLYSANNNNAFSHRITGLTNYTLGIFGDDGLTLGHMAGNTMTTRMELIESPTDGTADHIRSYGNWNFKGFVFHNANIRNCSIMNSFSNDVTRRTTETMSLEVEGRQVNFTFTDVKIRNGKTILSIPNRYKGIIAGYDIISIVKKGKSNVWIEEERENSFSLCAEDDISLNVTITMYFSDVAAMINENEEAQIKIIEDTAKEDRTTIMKI